MRVNAEEADGDQIHEGKVQENESVVWGSPTASFQTMLVVFATATNGGAMSILMDTCSAEQ